MQWKKILSILAYIILFNILAGITAGCRDIAFNNPLDPDASAEAVTIIKVMNTGLSGKGDLCFDEEKFWKINTYGNLTALDIESGITIRDLQTEGGTGITFLNGRLYLCGGDNTISVLDPLSGDILDRLSTQDLYPSFLTSQAGQLVLFDQRSESFFQFDPDNGQSHRLFQVSGLAVGGVVQYRGDFLVSDMNTDSFYHLSQGGTVLNVFRSPASGLSGITSDGLSYVYLLTLDGKIYKISLP